MTLDELTPWLFARVSGGMRWGIERTERLLAGVGDPHRHFHSVLIGGTNGKGSVAAYCESALRADGRRRVGLYTSPHLISFTERVRVDGQSIDPRQLASAAERLRPAIEETGASFFEATTAMAFLVMAEAGVELAVVEVGLGGRLDATNVLSPLVAGVTNVALDHTEYLGETLEAVAYEKAGILKSGVPGLLGERDQVALQVLERRAAEVGARIHRLGDLVAVDGVRIGLEGTSFRLDSERWGARQVDVATIGGHQAENAAFAAELLGLLPDGFRPEWEALERGFRSARWPGRLQVERIRGTTFVFDVAHNPAGAETLAEALRELTLPRPIVGLVSILRDKDWRSMLKTLANVLDAIVVTIPASAPPARRWDLADVGLWSASELTVAVREIPELATAVSRAATLAPHGTVVVTGSVHTVGDVMKLRGVPTD